MKRSSKFITILFGSLALLLSLQILIHEGVRRMNQVPLTELKPKPYAFGRFLIDLPEDMEVVSWRQEYKGAGPITVREGFKPWQFGAFVNQRAEELKASLHQEGGSLLEEVNSLSPPNCQQVLYWQNELLKDELECNAYYLFGHRVFMINPMTDPDPKSKQEMTLANEAIFKSLRLREDDEVPTEPGFCFQGGIITEDVSWMKHHSELIMVEIAWKSRPDVHFSFYALGNGEMLDPPLLERLKEAGSDPGESLLRSGNRTVGPFHGEEHLTRVREKNGTEGHFFIWESEGAPFDTFNPQLRLDMTTGGGSVNASLSDKDALRLWDAIVGSIRIRPTSEPKSGRGASLPNSDGLPVPPPSAPRVALGTRMRSRESCPESGIWECAHKDNLGRMRQTFRKGEELPPAVLDTHRTWFGKLLGRPGETVVATVWTLMGYEGAADGSREEGRH